MHNHDDRFDDEAYCDDDFDLYEKRDYLSGLRKLLEDFEEEIRAAAYHELKEVQECLADAIREIERVRDAVCDEIAQRDADRRPVAI